MTTTGKTRITVALSLAAALALVGAVWVITGIVQARATAPPAGSGRGSASTVRAVRPSVLERMRARSATSATPSRYYVWDQVTKPYAGPRDSRGVVMTQINGSRSPVYNPVGAGLWAIHFYENWLHSGAEAELKDFLVQADWLRRIQDDQGKFPYTYAKRGAAAPWYSAMAQGVGISVLLRAWQVSGDARFMTAAERAVLPFGKDVSEGGVVTGGGKWLEEYPDSHHVLNGSMFAAFGLWDMMRVTGRVNPVAGTTPTLAQRVWSSYTRNLAANLGRYESNGAILYELGKGNYCHITYFDLHLRQLRALADLTGNKVFRTYAQRWASSFRPYPDPAFTIKTSTDDLQRLVLDGRAVHVYRQYYTDTPHAEISVLQPDGTYTIIATVPMTYDKSGTEATFHYVNPTPPAGTTVRARVVEQPHTKDPAGRYDYQQDAAGLVVTGQ